MVVCRVPKSANGFNTNWTRILFKLSSTHYSMELLELEPEFQVPDQTQFKNQYFNIYDTYRHLQFLIDVEFEFNVRYLRRQIGSTVVWFKATKTDVRQTWDLGSERNISDFRRCSHQFDGKKFISRSLNLIIIKIWPFYWFHEKKINGKESNFLRSSTKSRRKF